MPNLWEEAPVVQPAAQPQKPLWEEAPVIQPLQPAEEGAVALPDTADTVTAAPMIKGVGQAVAGLAELPGAVAPAVAGGIGSLFQKQAPEQPEPPLEKVFQEAEGSRAELAAVRDRTWRQGLQPTDDEKRRLDRALRAIGRTKSTLATHSDREGAELQDWAVWALTGNSPMAIAELGNLGREMLAAGSPPTVDQLRAKWQEIHPDKQWTPEVQSAAERNAMSAADAAEFSRLTQLFDVQKAQLGGRAEVGDERLADPNNARQMDAVRTKKAIDAIGAKYNTPEARRELTAYAYTAGQAFGTEQQKPVGQWIVEGLGRGLLQFPEGLEALANWRDDSLETNLRMAQVAGDLSKRNDPMLAKALGQAAEMAPYMLVGQGMYVKGTQLAKSLGYGKVGQEVAGTLGMIAPTMNVEVPGTLAEMKRRGVKIGPKEFLLAMGDGVLKGIIERINPLPIKTPEGSTLLGKTWKWLVGTFKELSEEGLQGATGQIAANIASKDPAQRGMLAVAAEQMVEAAPGLLITMGVGSLAKAIPAKLAAMDDENKVRASYRQWFMDNGFTAKEADERGEREVQRQRKLRDILEQAENAKTLAEKRQWWERVGENFLDVVYSIAKPTTTSAGGIPSGPPAAKTGEIQGAQQVQKAAQPDGYGGAPVGPPVGEEARGQAPVEEGGAGVPAGGPGVPGAVQQQPEVRRPFRVTLIDDAGNEKHVVVTADTMEQAFEFAKDKYGDSPWDIAESPKRTLDRKWRKAERVDAPLGYQGEAAEPEAAEVPQPEAVAPEAQQPEAPPVGEPAVPDWAAEMGAEPQPAPEAAPPTVTVSAEKPKRKKIVVKKPRGTTEADLEQIAQEAVGEPGAQTGFKPASDVKQDFAVGGFGGRVYSARYEVSDFGTERRVIVQDASGQIIGQRDPFWEKGVPASKKARRERIADTAKEIAREYEQAAGIATPPSAAPAPEVTPEEPRKTLAAKGATPEPAAAPVAQGERQPWEMTLLEYGKSRLPPSVAEQVTDPRQVKNFSAQHIKDVKAAVEQGLPVPRGVLLEYRGTEWADKALGPEGGKTEDAAEKPQPVGTRGQYAIRGMEQEAAAMEGERDIESQFAPELDRLRALGGEAFADQYRKLVPALVDRMAKEQKAEDDYDKSAYEYYESVAEEFEDQLPTPPKKLTKAANRATEADVDAAWKALWHRAVDVAEDRIQAERPEEAVEEPPAEEPKQRSEADVIASTVAEIERSGDSYVAPATNFSRREEIKLGLEAAGMEQFEANRWRKKVAESTLAGELLSKPAGQSRIELASAIVQGAAEALTRGETIKQYLPDARIGKTLKEMQRTARLWGVKPGKLNKAKLADAVRGEVERRAVERVPSGPQPEVAREAKEGERGQQVESQWKAAKEAAGDAVLLFQVGDFFEMFGPDADVGASVLELSKTTAKGGMVTAGFPKHLLDRQVKKLVAAGHRVAVAGQVQEGAGPVSREVTRVVTEGSLVESAAKEGETRLSGVPPMREPQPERQDVVPPPREAGARFLRAFRELDKQGTNMVHLALLRKKLGINPQSFDAIVQDLRKQGILSLSQGEWSLNAPERKMGGGIQEGGQNLVLAMVRDPAEAAQYIADVEANRPASRAAGIPGLRFPGRQRTDTVPDAARADNAELEKFLVQNRGVKRPGLLKRAAAIPIKLWHVATRPHEHIPNKPEFAFYRENLRLLEGVGTAMQDEVNRTVAAILDELGPKQKAVYERTVIARNMAAARERGEPKRVPIPDDDLYAYRDKMNDLADRIPEVKNALDTRMRIVSDLVKQLADKKVFSEEAGKRALENVENYFHQQVLEYAVGKRIGGGIGPRRRKISVSHKRVMGPESLQEYPFNTDYIESEVDWMTEAKIELAKIKWLEGIEQHVNSLTEDERKGFVEWFPRPGNVFYQAFSIPEKLAEQLASGAIDTLELTADELKTVLAVGGKRKPLLLPPEVAEQFDALAKDQTTGALSWLDAAAKEVQRLWKARVTIAFDRAIPYMLRNMTGDADPVIAAAPEIAKYAAKYAHELRGFYYGKIGLNKNLRDARDLSVMSAGMTAQEVPDLKDLILFERFYDAKGLSLANIVFPPGLKRFNEFREALLRYGAYRYYLDKLNAGEVFHYGGARKSTVDIIRETMGNEAAAAHLSRNLLGDYGNLTVLGQWLRTRLVPFWSWNEINIKRYPMLMANALQYGKDAGARAGGKSLAKATAAGAVYAGVAALRIAALSAAVWLWNNLRFPEEEKQLSNDERSSPHIILGTKPDGSIMVFRNVGALGDFAEWFGLNSLIKLLPMYQDGQLSMESMLKEIGKDPFNKFYQAVGPQYKTPFESLAGASMYPDFANPRSVDPWENIAQSVGLRDVLKGLRGRLTGSGERGRKNSAERLFYGVIDPRESAMHEMHDLRRKFLEQKGKGGDTGIYPKSKIAVMREAAASRDLVAFAEAKTKYIEGGGTKKKFMEALDRLDPLHSRLTNKDEKEFVENYLTDVQRQKLNVARLYSQEMRDVLLLYWDRTPDTAPPKTGAGAN